MIIKIALSRRIRQHRGTWVGEDDSWRRRQAEPSTPNIVAVIAYSGGAEPDADFVPLLDATLNSGL